MPTESRHPGKAAASGEKLQGRRTTVEPALSFAFFPGALFCAIGILLQIFSGAAPAAAAPAVSAVPAVPAAEHATRVPAERSGLISSDDIRSDDLRATVQSLSTSGSRAIGSTGYHQAGEYIKSRLKRAGLEPHSLFFDIPVRTDSTGSTPTIRVGERSEQLYLLNNNVISPQSLADPKGQPLSGPVVYGGDGSLAALDGSPVKESIVLLDFTTGSNWQSIAALGAKAVIFLYEGTPDSRFLFTEKRELSPLRFPCFFMDRSRAEALVGPLLENSRATRSTPATPATPAMTAHLSYQSQWSQGKGENIYALAEGSDDELKKQLIILEAFYDSEELVAGNSPGADSSSSVATLLELADHLATHPAKRSVLLLATAGQPQNLAGMREAVWSISSPSRQIRQEKKNLQELLARITERIDVLAQTPNATTAAQLTGDTTRLFKAAIASSLDERTDTLSRQLMALRFKEQNAATKTRIKQLAEQRMAAKRLGWRERYDELPQTERALLNAIIPAALENHKLQQEDLRRQKNNLKSAKSFRDLVRDYETAAIVSLHLSSHGNGIGAFNQGFLYKLKANINRTPSFARLADLLENAGQQFAAHSPAQRARYQDSLRPSHQRSLDSWFLDRPALGGEISTLGGYLGLSLVTTGDGRFRWGTPGDLPTAVDYNYLAEQANLLLALLEPLYTEPRLDTGKEPRNGFATVTGRSNLLLQGELFANHPAAGSVILAYQGMARYYAMVDSQGRFTLKGVADKKNVLDKLIIEGYRFDPLSGESIWAIDKKETGIQNYRLKILRKEMQTDLVMFNSVETTIFNLLEPRNLNYLTKLQLYDGRRDAVPEHYWFSRIDTRDSTVTSIYTEPGTRLKLTLSDTVLTNKFILTNGTTTSPLGLGYPVDQTPSLPHTLLHAAQDAWTLLLPRVRNLERHGIYDEKLSQLSRRGQATLKLAEQALQELNYTSAREKAGEALALAVRVYGQVEKTQRDVLFGVLFYIALFVPFAFIMERFLFNYSNIYKRILAFTLLLVVLIAVIYNVHPAFELAYSPLVVVLAFFIIGLSFVVSLIIFNRFETEMLQIQRRASQFQAVELSRAKAFGAAFFLGVSNLRRRRLRTMLTITTLVILTFTIMSFTTIKSGQKQVKLRFHDQAPYHGLLLKKVNWQSLPRQAGELLISALPQHTTPALRVWLESDDPSQPISLPIRNGDNQVNLTGLLGLSAAEARVTALDKLLSAGRWFTKQDGNAIILEQATARRLGVNGDGHETVSLWGRDFIVTGIIDGAALETHPDLDGEPLTPVIFPQEAGQERSEEELEALESGDDVRSLQSRYSHIPAGQIAIIPAATLQAMGGSLKSIGLQPPENEDADQLAAELADRFNLAIFVGDGDGVSLYNLSDTMNYSGVPDIVIPLLISVLIVLNTMISSVYERKNEIAVYTSVGLAPSHVAFLFIAEALALGIVSVVLGYLVAQTSAALLAKSALWAGITVNYSSLAGVAAMVLVLLVALVSVIYPARLAARIAMPDVTRSFTLPRPKENTIEVTLPFLMKPQEFQSICGFVHHYLNSHRDISHGIFSTGDVHLTAAHPDTSEPTDFTVTARVWLAPFDFGIMQLVTIRFRNVDGGFASDRFLEIALKLERHSGEATTWLRVNKVFIHELRKQLLTWRSQDNQAHLEFAERFASAREQLDKGEADNV